MRVYSYDKDGFYTGKEIASINPRVKGEYLIPANSTTVNIPTLTENQRARFNKGKKEWEIYTLTTDVKNIIVDTEFKEIREMNLEEQVIKGIIVLSEYQKISDNNIVNKTYSELIVEEIRTLEDIKLELIKELSNKVNYLIERGKAFNINGVIKYHKARTEDSIASQVVIERAIEHGVDIVEKYRLFDADGNSAWTSLTIEEIQNMLKECQDWVIFTLYSQRASIENEINNLTVENIDDYVITISEV